MAHWFIEPDAGSWAVRNGRRRIRSGLTQEDATTYVLGLLGPSDTAVLIEQDGYRSPLKARRKRSRR